jgi:hypothetical protein
MTASTVATPTPLDLTPDPWADRLSPALEGSTTFVTTVPRAEFIDNATGLRVENADYCRATKPGRPGLSFCTRAAGHPADWQHVSTTPTGKIVWTVTPPVPPDPHAEVTVGDLLDEVPTDLRANDAGVACQVELSGHGLHCTRLTHRSAWQHVVVSGSGRVLATWGGEPTGLAVDPYADLVLDTRRSELVGDWRNATTGIYTNGATCAVRSPDDSWHCTRPEGHPTHWNHVVMLDGRIRAIWGATTPTPSMVFVATEPDDPTLRDDPTTRFTRQDPPEIGAVVRLAHFATIYVVLHVRADGTAELLDVTNQGYAEFAITSLVPSDYALTGEDMKFFATWFADHRKLVRAVAVREHRADRWCREGLNRALAEMGLDPWEPPVTGKVRIEIPFEMDDASPAQTSSAIRDLVRATLGAGKQLTDLVVLPDSIPGMTVTTGAIRADVIDIHRR